MWALPTLSALDADYLVEDFKQRQLWCLLLFPKSHKQIVAGLKENWELFSHALGDNAHLITLLDSETPNSSKKLKLSPDYDSVVGDFCNKLGVRIDELPALFILNAPDQKETPYISLRWDRSTQISEAIKTLIDDIRNATLEESRDLDAEKWRAMCSKKLFSTLSKRQAVSFVKHNIKSLQKLVPVLIKALKQHWLP